MSEPCDEGGEAPCYAHLFAEEDEEQAEAPEAGAAEGQPGNAEGPAAVADG